MTSIEYERRSVETNDDGGYWTYREAQAWSGLGRTTLWKLLSSGRIKGTKSGKAVRISRKSLAEYMEQQDYAEAVRK